MGIVNLEVPTKKCFYEIDTSSSLNEKFGKFRNKINRSQIIFNDVLVFGFKKLGSLVASKPAFFILIPVILACVAATGLLFTYNNNDFASLSLPESGEWKEEKEAVEENFHYNTTNNFNPLRMTKFGHFVNLIVSAKDGKNILRNEIWSSILELDSNITHGIVTSTDSLIYRNLCAKWKNSCFYPMLPIRPDELLILGKIVEKMTVSNWTNNFKVFPYIKLSVSLMLGNPEFDVNGLLLSADSISLYYFLKSDTPQDVERSKEWESRAADFVDETNFTNINVLAFSSRTPDDEVKLANNHMKPYLAACGILMVVFAALSAAMQDWVRSKIILSIIGIMSVVLATGAAFGILIYNEVPFIGMNYVTIFLMLGIGIDDMFVFLAAWRMTSLEDSVEKRLASTYGHACIAVTVTSLTNGVAFLIGTFTNIRTIEIFSIYSCTSVFFTYVFFLTFFGGWLAVFGHLERNQRHSILCCLRVLPKSLSETKNRFYRTFLAGGINHLDPKNPTDNKDHLGMTLIRDYLSYFLNNNKIKVAVIVIYMCYAITSIYGCTKLQLETNPYRVFLRNSTRDYFNAYDRYFRKKPSFVQVILPNRLNYNDEFTRESILNLHDALEELPFVRKNLTISWMRHQFKLIPKKFSRNFNLLQQMRMVDDTHFEMTNYTNSENCISILNDIANNIKIKDLYNEANILKLLTRLENTPCDIINSIKHIVLKEKLVEDESLVQYLELLFWVINQIRQLKDNYKLDTRWDEKTHDIQASRFLIVVEDSGNFTVQNTLREVVKHGEIPGVKIFNQQAIIMDQVELVKETTISATISTTVVVLFISLLFIPNPIASIWVVFSIISIEIGVIGFMALWGVNLNAVSMVNLIMCVGFSVDFSAHISCAYLNAGGTTSKERLEEALFSVGLPILLGGSSTIIGIIPICFSDNSIFMTFFKIIFLVIFWGMFHALIFLPVSMTIIGPETWNRYITGHRTTKGNFGNFSSEKTPLIVKGRKESIDTLSKFVDEKLNVSLYKNGITYFEDENNIKENELNHQKAAKSLNLKENCNCKISKSLKTHYLIPSIANISDNPAFKNKEIQISVLHFVYTVANEDCQCLGNINLNNISEKSQN